MKFTPSTEIAAKIETLTAALTAVSSGAAITFAQLSAALGEPVAGRDYVLRHAIAKAEQITGALFDSVRGVGYQRLPTAAVPNIGKKANARIRRQARRARQRLEGFRANDMTSAEVAAISAYRAHFGMMEGLAQESAVRALQAACIDQSGIAATPQAIAAQLNAALGGKDAARDAGMKELDQ